jgi:hypothetical protein
VALSLQQSGEPCSFRIVSGPRKRKRLLKHFAGAAKGGHLDVRFAELPPGCSLSACHFTGSLWCQRVQAAAAGCLDYPTELMVSFIVLLHGRKVRTLRK